MSDDQDVNDGFTALIRKPQSTEVTVEARGGTGIAQTKTDQQVSGYRDLVRRQLERRKLGKAKHDEPSPAPKKLTSSKSAPSVLVSGHSSATSSKSSIEVIVPSGSIPTAEIIKPGNSLNSSIELNEPSNHVTASPIHSIETIDPRLNPSIEENDTVDTALSRSYSSIEMVDPSNDHANIIQHPETPTRIYTASNELSAKAPAEVAVRRSETNFVGNLNSSLDSANLLLENADSSASNTSLESSIEDFNLATGSNSSVEHFDLTIQNSLSEIPSVEINELGSIVSTETFEPANNQISASKDADPISSIEFFDPFIPLSDHQIYSVKINGNYTKLAHSVFKHAGKLDAKTFYLYLYLYRMSYGWNKNTSQIPLSQYYIKNALNYSKNTVVKCMQKLMQLKLVQQKDVVAGIGSVFHIRYFSDQGETLDIVPDKNFLALDNNFFELSAISTTAKIIYLYLYKESFGFGSNHTGRLLTSEIAKHLNLTTRTIQECIRELLNKKIISRQEEVFSSNGILYRVHLPQEIQTVKNKTPIEFKIRTENNNRTGWGSNPSIEENTPGSVSSIEANSKTSSHSSIEGIDLAPSLSPHPNDISTFSSAESEVSIEGSGHNETKTILNKTSSGQVDDVLNFFIQQTRKHPGFSFAIARKKISEIIERHSTDYLKATFEKMLPAMMRDGVTNPVGLYLHALETPESYTMLQKPSAKELADQKRYENQIELKEKSFIEEFKRIIDNKQEVFWNGLAEEARQEAIDRRRVEMGQGGELKIPEGAIKRSALERLFWENCKQTWLALGDDERTVRTNKARQTIINRVYAGEGKLVPNPLPERDFLKSVHEMAQKLAMMAAGRGWKNEKVET